MKFNLGDKIIFDYRKCLARIQGKDCKDDIRGVLFYLGIVIQVNDNSSYHIMFFCNPQIRVAHNVHCSCIKPLSEVEVERERIKTLYDKLIEEEKGKLVSVSQVEKDREKVERYKDIKRRIIRNCERCISTDLDDEDFVNRVKEISNLKKQLFCPERLPCISTVRKLNGVVKVNIRELEVERTTALNRISDEEIKLRLSPFK